MDRKAWSWCVNPCWLLEGIAEKPSMGASAASVKANTPASSLAILPMTVSMASWRWTKVYKPENYYVAILIKHAQPPAFISMLQVKTDREPKGQFVTSSFKSEQGMNNQLNATLLSPVKSLFFQELISLWGYHYGSGVSAPMFKHPLTSADLNLMSLTEWKRNT